MWVPQLDPPRTAEGNDKPGGGHQQHETKPSIGKRRLCVPLRKNNKRITKRSRTDRQSGVLSRRKKLAQRREEKEGKKKVMLKTHKSYRTSNRGDHTRIRTPTVVKPQTSGAAQGRRNSNCSWSDASSFCSTSYNLGGGGGGATIKKTLPKARKNGEEPIKVNSIDRPITQPRSPTSSGKKSQKDEGKTAGYEERETFGRWLACGTFRTHTGGRSSCGGGTIKGNKRGYTAPPRR